MDIGTAVLNTLERHRDAAVGRANLLHGCGLNLRRRRVQGDDGRKKDRKWKSKLQGVNRAQAARTKTASWAGEKDWDETETAGASASTRYETEARGKGPALTLNRKERKVRRREGEKSVGENARRCEADPFMMSAPRRVHARSTGGIALWSSDWLMDKGRPTRLFPRKGPCSKAHPRGPCC